MNWLVALYLAILFYVLSPNVLVRLPPNGNKMTVSATHAAIFGILVYLTTKMVWRLSMSMGIYEGMANKGGKPKAPPKKK